MVFGRKFFSIAKLLTGIKSFLAQNGQNIEKMAKSNKRCYPSIVCKFIKHPIRVFQKGGENWEEFLDTDFPIPNAFIEPLKLKFLK